MLILKQLALDGGADFPLATPVSLSRVFVDDAMIGTNYIATAQKIRVNSLNFSLEADFPYEHGPAIRANCSAILTKRTTATKSVCKLVKRKYCEDSKIRSSSIEIVGGADTKPARRAASELSEGINNR